MKALGSNCFTIFVKRTTYCMLQKLDLGDHNSRWTTAQGNRLVEIVDSELGFNHLYLDDDSIETVLDKIEKRYNVGQGNERKRGSLRSRLKKLRKGIYLHVFQEYERKRRDGRKYTWKGGNPSSTDWYKPAEINELDNRLEEKNLSFKLFIRHDVDKQKASEELVARAHIGLDWIIEGESAYYVMPKIHDTDYAKMFVDVFTLDRFDKLKEYQVLVNERRRMYEIDFLRKPVPLSKDEQYLSVSIFTDLLLVHLIEMTWIMAIRARSKTIVHSWDSVRDMIRRARKCRLISRQAEKVISGFLEEKEKNGVSTPFNSAGGNLSDVYVGSSEEEYDSLVDVLARILSSAEDVNARALLIPPFRIDMPKLFELYIYFLLSKMDKGKIKPLIHYQATCKLAAFDDLSKSGTPQPDFLIEGKGVLIDAKYKVDYNTDSYYSNLDVRQLLSYSRLCTVLNICSPKGELKTIIAFSSVGATPATNSLSDMSNTSLPQVEQNRDAIELYKCGFPLPKIQ